MKFLVHIGGPKTGSSFLQSACACARKELKAQGIYFPRGTPHDEQSMLAGQISAGNAVVLAKDVWRGRWAQAERSLRSYCDEARSQGCERVLLSSEWFLGALSQPGRLLELCARLRQVGADSIEFLLIMREPVGQLISHYKHRAKSGQVGPLDAWIGPCYVLPRRLAELRKQLDESGAKLTVRGYDNKPGAMATRFFKDWLGVDVSVGETMALVNPSLSLSELVLLRRLRQSQPVLVPFLYEQLAAIDPDLKMEGSAMKDYARSVASAAVAGYAEEWHYWNAMLPESERFPVPGRAADPGAEPDALMLSATQLAALMKLLEKASTPGFVLRMFWSGKLRPVLSGLRRRLMPWHARQ